MVFGKIIDEDLERVCNQNQNLSELYSSKILITGGYGMLASYLVFLFVYLNKTRDAKIEIYVQGRNREKMISRFGVYCDESFFHIITNSITEPFDLEEGMDYIVHAASHASPDYYSSVPVDVLAPNTIGTYNLLEYAKKCNLKKFLFFSSSEVYGDSLSTMESISVDSFSGMNPTVLRNCYAESKRMGETMCVAANSQYGIPVACIRFFHTYSPTMNTRNDSRVFAQFINNVLNNENVVLYSDGKAERYFCYISDAIDACCRILLCDENLVKCNLCNIHAKTTILGLAHTLAHIYPDKKLEVVFKQRDNHAYIPSKVNVQPEVDCSFLTNLGWNPQIGIAEGFKRVLDCHESMKKNDILI